MPPRQHHRPLPVDCLAALAEIAEARLVSPDDDAGGRPDGADASEGPCLVRARVLGDEVELGWRPLAAGVHPVDELAGTVVPRGWAAVGVAAFGWAHQLALSGTPAAIGTRVRVRTAHLVGRDGAWASRWAPVDPADGDGDAIAGAPGDDGGRPIGRIDDVCRRALGLPTPPPETGTAGLWATMWLDTIAERAADGDRGTSLPWPIVASLHPAVPALWTADRHAPTPAELAGLADQLASWRDWQALRRACGAGTWSLDDVPAPLARWLDDGSFARWVLGAYPDLVDLVAIVADVLDPVVADQVADTLAASTVAGR